jgi:predicted CopG family antitoxin
MAMARRKTVSLAPDVHRLLRRKQERRESLSAALRRLLADEKDPADHLDDLFAQPPKVDLALLRHPQQQPPRSRSPHRAG